MKLERTIQPRSCVHPQFSQLWVGRIITLLAIFSVATFARADGPAERRAQARFEIPFMTEMIDHHAMAIEMGMLCVEKAVHPDLKELCEEMMVMQSAEIEQMQTWLHDWYGVEHEPEMTPDDERQLGALREAV